MVCLSRYLKSEKAPHKLLSPVWSQELRVQWRESAYFPPMKRKRACPLIYLPSAALPICIHSEGFMTIAPLSLVLTKQSSVCSHRESLLTFEMLQLSLFMAMPNHSKFTECIRFPKRKQLQQMVLCFQATIKCTSPIFFCLRDNCNGIKESLIFNITEGKIYTVWL